jgi:ABC-type nickel/cobalt efflux system permease component RcnA
MHAAVRQGSRRGTGFGNPGLRLVFVSLTLFAIVPRLLVAHPMGNFSINHYAGIHIGSATIELRYILDMAEIPTFQEIQQNGIVPKVGNPSLSPYLARKAEVLKAGLTLTLNGRPLAVQTISEDVIFPAGAGGLPTMKFGVIYRAPLQGAACPCIVEYHDSNFPERAGWKEVVATAGSGITLTSSTAAAASRSQELANYPTDLISSPPQDLSARLTFTLLASSLVSKTEARATVATPSFQRAAGGNLRPRASADDGLRPRHAPESRRLVATLSGSRHEAAEKTRGSEVVPNERVLTEPLSHARAAKPVPTSQTAPHLTLVANKLGTPHSRFTELIASKRWGFWFLLTAAIIAAALGGLHALEPGHGKTIVAAYLVGSQGTAAQALMLGLIVTATHTAGVYGLGLVTLYASRSVVPDHLYPWLGFISGLIIAGLGIYMLRQRYAGRAHAHGHHHHHHDHYHDDHEHGIIHAHHHSHDGDDHTHYHVHEYAHDHNHGGGSAHPIASGARSGRRSASYHQLLALGVTGGIVPCPAALVVLLSAVSLHRIAFGLYLIVAFSLGLAAVLISIGLLTVYARRLIAHLPTDGPIINRWLPVASAAVITLLGAGIAAQALVAMGVLHLRL